MTPTLSWVPVLRIDLNFISHSNRDFTHIFIPWDESWWFTSTVMSCVPQISQKTSCLKFPQSFPTKFPKKFPEVSKQKFLQQFRNFGSNFHPKKTKFFEISLTNLIEAAMAVKESAGDLDGPWEEHPNGLIFAKKNRSRRKMGSFFSFIFVLPGDLFFENWDPGFIIQRLTLTCI